MPRLSLRAAAITGATIFLATLAGPAAAHVTVNAPGATAGGFTKLTFRVPSEKESATTKLEVAFPAEQPLAFVSVKPHAGWSYKVERAKLPQPVQVEGEEVTEAVSRIIWTATGPGIKAGEFDEFEVSAGALPEAPTMSFPALQTYADGEVRRWIEPTVEGGEEPESPAPVLNIAAASATEGETTAPTAAASTSADSDDESDEGPSGLAIAGFVIALVALLLAAAAFVRGRATGTKAAV